MQILDMGTRVHLPGTLGKLAAWTQINSFERKIVRLVDMSRIPSIRIDIRLAVRMKQSGLLAAKNRLQTRWIGKSKNSKVWTFTRCANYRNAFRQHDLVPTMRVQVP